MCKAWNIPFLSLDSLSAEEISEKVEQMDPKPRVILSTISRVANKDMQSAIRRLPVVRICIDEVQVNYTVKLQCLTKTFYHSLLDRALI